MLAAVRAYVSATLGARGDDVASVTRFEDGNRHWVYRVSVRNLGDVVVRVCYSGDEIELERAEREAAVLELVGGVAGPELYDFARTSEWFDAPVMCMQFMPGHQRELRTVSLPRIRELGALVAWVHARPLDGLSDGLGEMTSLPAYAEQRLRRILSKLVWARDPLPRGLQDRLRQAADLLVGARGSVGFESGETLALLHGDIGPGNVLWQVGPCLIDWEYTRLGDPADELAYTFDQNELTPSQRRAFWDGYRQGVDEHGADEHSADGRVPGHVAARAEWWEPVTLLGSTLWWVERWVRRVEQPGDPGVPRAAEYYLDHVMRRIDRLESLQAR